MDIVSKRTASPGRGGRLKIWTVFSDVPISQVPPVVFSCIGSRRGEGVTLAWPLTPGIAMARMYKGP